MELMSRPPVAGHGHARQWLAYATLSGVAHDLFRHQLTAPGRASRVTERTRMADSASEAIRAGSKMARTTPGSAG